MSVRAKFSCVSVKAMANNMAEIVCQAVNRGNSNADNEQWSKWTPSGNLTMSCTNPEATAQFTPGKDYFLTIEEVPAAV